MKTRLLLLFLAVFSMSCRSTSLDSGVPSRLHLAPDWKQQIADYWATNQPDSRIIVAYTKDSPRTEPGTFRNSQGAIAEGVFVEHYTIRNLGSGGFSTRNPKRAFFSKRVLIGIENSDTGQD